MAVLLLIVISAAVLGPVYLAVAFRDSHPVVAYVCLGLFVAEMVAFMVGVVIHERGKERRRRQRSLLVPRPSKPHGWDGLVLALLLAAAVVAFGVALACPLSRAIIWSTGVFAAGTLAALVYRTWPRTVDRRPREVRPEVVQAYREFAPAWVPPAELQICAPRPVEYRDSAEVRRDQAWAPLRGLAIALAIANAVVLFIEPRHAPLFFGIAAALLGLLAVFTLGGGSHGADLVIGGAVVPALVADVAQVIGENSTWYVATVYFELDERPHVVAIHVSKENFAALSSQIADQPLQGHVFAALVHPEKPTVAQFYACSRYRVASS